VHEDRPQISEGLFLTTIKLFLETLLGLISNRKQIEDRMDKMATDIATIQAKLAQVQVDYTELKDRVTADYNDRVAANAAQQEQITALKQQIADLIASGGGATQAQLESLDAGLTALSADMDAQDLNPAFPATPPVEPPTE
jgi:chromosome segregation ATPase